MDELTTRGRIRLSPDQIAVIRDSVGSVRAVAARVGCGKSSVAYHRGKLYDERLGRADTPEEPGTIPYTRLTTPQRCPRHGLQRVWPCVQCGAESAIYDQ